MDCPHPTKGGDNHASKFMPSKLVKEMEITTLKRNSLFAKLDIRKIDLILKMNISFLQ
jgi:hypothetical protein